MLVDGLNGAKLDLAIYVAGVFPKEVRGSSQQRTQLISVRRSRNSTIRVRSPTYCRPT